MPWSKTITVPAGKQLILRGHIDDTLYDGKYLAGLAANDDASKAMILIDDGCTLNHVGITRSRGVGCCIVGKNISAHACEFFDNASSGRTGKSRGDGTPGSAYNEIAAHLHGNNRKNNDGNAGNKITRSADYLITNALYEDECGPAQWLDISNERITFGNCTFKYGSDHSSKSRDPLFRSELTLPGGIHLDQCTFGPTPNAALSIDESRNVEILDPTFAACRYAAELRNMLRRDDPTGKWRNGQPVDPAKFTWRTDGITINGKIITTKNTGPIVRSNASNATITMHGNHLWFGAPLTVRIPA